MSLKMLLAIIDFLGSSVMRRGHSKTTTTCHEEVPDEDVADYDVK